jgi:serine/threonine-protein kinase
MAPETFRGEAIDGRTDLWSAGVVVWELLAGRPLFNCENRRQMLERILRDPIPTLAEHRPDLPSSIVFFVHALLHRERTLRPADALGRLRALAAREGWDLGRDRLANLVRQILSDTGWRVTIVPQPAS